MSVSPWVEYLDGRSDYVHSAQRALHGREDVAVGPLVACPSGPVPEEYAWRLLELVAETTSALGDERHRTHRLLDTCRGTTQRVLARARR